MSSQPKIHWLDIPADKDYDAAESFLGLLVPPDRLIDVVERLRTAPSGRWEARDLLRAAGLALLKPKQSTEVAGKMREIEHATPISPILLIGGLREYLVIADGYHRACAACRVDEASMVPGRLLWLT